MTDVTLPTGRPARVLDTTSAAAKARVKARYRKEARFQAYGIAAIAFAALFLVVLLGDIFLRAFPAFTINDFSAETVLSKESLDPNNSGQLQDVMQSGDFDAPMREALRAALPEMSSRQQRRDILSVFSQTGAGDRLREAVRNDLSLIGQTVRMNAVLDPNVDLYLKGQITEVDDIVGRGVATPSDVSGEITVATNGNDFAADLDRVKQIAAQEIARVEREIGLSQQLLTGLSTEERAGLEANIAAAQQRLELLKADAGGAGAVKLSDALPSMLLRINGGVLKVSEISPSQVAGTVIFPLSSASAAGAGQWSIRHIAVPASLRKITDQQIVFADILKERGFIARSFNWPFFFGKDSAQPETAGLLSGLVGSALMLLVTLLVCLPLGVGAAIYLEEFAPKNAFTR